MDESRASRIVVRPDRALVGGPVMPGVRRSLTAGVARIPVVGGIAHTCVQVTGEVVETTAGAVAHRAAGAVGVVVGAVVSAIDINRILAAVDLDAVVSRLDIAALVARIDLDAIVDQVDLDRAVARVDIDAIIDRIDLVGLANSVIDGVDLPDIIRDASTSVTADVMTDVRSSSERADDAVAGIVNRVLRRKADRVDGDD